MSPRVTSSPRSYMCPLYAATSMSTPRVKMGMTFSTPSFLKPWPSPISVCDKPL